MLMPKLPKDLKEAILQMPGREKDKLLLRLVAKDEALVERLVFQLLEGGETTESRAETLRQLIDREIPKGAGSFYTPGYLLMDMRYCNGRISEHVKTTKDKLGDVQLRLQVLRLAFERHENMLHRFPPHRSRTFSKYVVGRLRYILGKAGKLHEDYFLELRDELGAVLAYTFRFEPTAAHARAEGLPTSFEAWLEGLE